MRATTQRASHWPNRSSTVDRPWQSRKRPREHQPIKRQSHDEASERRERILHERVTYLLWIMAQAMD